MRHLSLIAIVAIIIAAPTIAGSAKDNLPGIGTFSYSGAPVATPAPMVVAGLTRAERS